MANKVAAAEQAAKPLADMEASLLSARAAAAKSKAAADAECSSGRRKLCKAAREIEDRDANHVSILEVRREAMTPAKVAASDYHQIALVLAAVTGRDAAAIETALSLIAPFLLVFVCEVCAICFGNLGLGHREVPEPANDDLPLERTEDEVIDWKEM